MRLVAARIQINESLVSRQHELQLCVTSAHDVRRTTQKVAVTFFPDFLKKVLNENIIYITKSGLFTKKLHCIKKFKFYISLLVRSIKQKRAKMQLFLFFRRQPNKNNNKKFHFLKLKTIKKNHTKINKIKIQYRGFIYMVHHHFTPLGQL